MACVPRASPGNVTLQFAKVHVNHIQPLRVVCASACPDVSVVGALHKPLINVTRSPLEPRGCGSRRML